MQNINIHWQIERYQEGFMNSVARINSQILPCDLLCVTALMQHKRAQKEIPSAADQEVVPVKSSKFKATGLDTFSLKYCQNVISVYHRSSRVLPAWRISNRLCGVFCLWHDERAQRDTIVFIAFPVVMLNGPQTIAEKINWEALTKGH